MTRKHCGIPVGFLGIGLLFATHAAYAQALEAGVARTDITPPLGLLLQGYSNPERTATGVRDPLYARVLVLQTGATRLALVDLDLVAPFGPEYLAQLRVKTKADASGHLIVAAIHTHSGPALIPTASPPPGAWETTAVDKVAAAVHQATTHMVAVRLGVGYGVAYLGHNRLCRQRDGTVTWFERNWTKVPTAPVDPTVAVLRVDDMRGTPLAILINYACHPVIFGPDSRLYSADFPAVTEETVEKALAGNPLCFFLQGGDGDINPYYAVTPLERGAVELREKTGAELGRVVAQTAQHIRTVVDADPSLQFAEDYTTFGPRWDAGEWRAADPQHAETISLKTKPTYELPITTALIDKSIALLAMPGEPFVDFQTQWRARCPVSDCFFLGYVNGYYGYFPTIRAASWGGYGASHESTWIEVGAGERMLNHGLMKVYEMLGRLKPDPEDLQK